MDNVNTVWDIFNDVVEDHVVTVVFEKKNGDKRVMECTLNPEYFPDYEFKGDGVVNNDPDMKTVWDVEVDGWRKVTKKGLISVEVSDNDTD